MPLKRAQPTCGHVPASSRALAFPKFVVREAPAPLQSWGVGLCNEKPGPSPTLLSASPTAELQSRLETARAPAVSAGSSPAARPGRPLSCPSVTDGQLINALRARQSEDLNPASLETRA